MDRVKAMKLKALILMNTFLSGCISAEIGNCKEETGFIEKNSLITVIDINCDDNTQDGLCSALLGAPKNFENRDFKLFTFLRSDSSGVKTFLNLKPQYTTSDVRVGFEFDQLGANQITITSVYENIEGCTLRSSINLGEKELGSE